MADYIGITESQSNPFAPLTSELVKQLRDNPIAIAEGAPGAPRVVGDALDLRIVEVDPAGMESVVFTDLEPTDWTLEFYTIQTDTTNGRTLILDPSYDNGNTFLAESDEFIILSGSHNFRDTGSGRLGGLSGFVNASNNYISNIVTGRPTVNNDINLSYVRPDRDIVNLRLNLHRFKPFQPMNAMRIRWTADSLFGADDNQRIVFYQGGRRPFGGKP